MIYRKSRSKISLAKENFSDHAGCLSLFWILTPKENEIIYDMVQTHYISSVAFNPVSSINWTAITMKATLGCCAHSRGTTKIWPCY